MQKYLFLDRDGVINEDFGYVYRISDLQLVSGIQELVVQALNKNYKVAILTNQSGLGRKYYTHQQFHAFMQNLTDLLVRSQDLTLSPAIQYYFCPHLPSNKCMCRKPATGLFEFCQKANASPIDWKNSIMIGDKLSDIIPAAKMGIPRRYLLDRRTSFSSSVNPATAPYFIKISSLTEVVL